MSVPYRLHLCAQAQKELELWAYAYVYAIGYRHMPNAGGRAEQALPSGPLYGAAPLPGQQSLVHSYL